MTTTAIIVTDCHPSMSPVVHGWALRVQDCMPTVMLSAADEHGQRWRQAAPLIAGSADPDKESARVDLIREWMWDCLAVDWETWVPVSAHEAWATMLRDRTTSAANAASDAAGYIATYPSAAARAAAAAAGAASHSVVYAYAAAYAARAAAYAAAGGSSAMWRTFNPAQLLEDLVTL